MRKFSSLFSKNTARSWVCSHVVNSVKPAARAVLSLIPILVLSTVAHAQGSVDLSGATTLMNTFKTFALYAGAVICLGSMIFAGIRLMGGRFQEAIPGLFGALFGAAVIDWGTGWISSLTGQSM